MSSEPRILQTAGGHTIEIHGGHLISPKLFDITAMLYTAGEYFGGYEVLKIIFTAEPLKVDEQHPKGRFAMYEHETKTISLSLSRHFDATCYNVQSEDDVNAKYISFKASLWFDLITSLLHEGFHAVQWETAPEHVQAASTDPRRKKEIEADATNNAELLIFDLFRDWDMEPPAISEEPYFSTRFMQFFIQSIQSGEDEWCLRQAIMVDSDLVYYDDKDNDGLGSMRQWLRLCQDGDPDETDERWERSPSKLPRAAVNPAVMVADANTTPKEVMVRPDTQIIAVGSNAQSVAQTVAEVAQTVPASPAVVNEFSMLMSEDELLSEVRESMGTISEEYVPPTAAEVADIPTEVGTAAVATEQFVQPSTTIETVEQAGDRALEMVDQSFCRKCNKQNDIMAKFCNACGNQLIVDSGPACAFGTDNNLPQFLDGTGNVATPEQKVQSQFVGGAGGAAPVHGVNTPPKFTQSLRTNLPNIGMDVGTMKTILAEVYERMHNHIFEKCGFQVCGAGTGNDVGFHPAHLGNILQPIPIGDIPRATELIVAYDKYDHTTGKTKMRVPITDGTINGKATKQDSIPFYAIYINNNGTECKRILMAQKPFKPTQNGYSPAALKAQQGNKISWVWDAGDGMPRRNWIYKIENGVSEWL